MLGVMTVIGIAYSLPAYARKEPGHNEDLRIALFGKAVSQDNKITQKGEENFRILCEAAYLTIDYYKDDDKAARYLKDLRQKGVEGLPNYKDIKYTCRLGDHQRFTHKGWNVSYQDERAHWEIRKKLLSNTVNTLGKFKDREEIKKDSFAGLVYEIHILGDHIGDQEATRWDRLRLSSDVNYKGQRVSPTSDGPFNNPTLIGYMIYHIQRLFREQKNSPYFKKLIRELEDFEVKFCSSEYYEYKDKEIPYDYVQALAGDVLDTLQKWLPKLLKNEAFFQRAFDL